MTEMIQKTSEKKLTRRSAIKVLLGAGAVVGAAAATNRIVDNEPTRVSCDDIPPATGNTVFDVYGNKTDSSDMLTVGYAEAVRRQECRDKDE